LVQLVRIIVDPGNQIAGLILVEERERQGLQPGEQGVSQIEKNGAAHSAHCQRLVVACEQTDKIDPKQNAGRPENALEVSTLNISVDRTGDDDRAKKAGSVRGEHCHESEGDRSLFVAQQRRKTLERRNNG
jgi:hypothetical protein